MNFHKFPDTVAPFVEKLSAAYKARIAAGRGNDRATRNETDWPAYRLPSGEIRIAHNLYRPEYPEGATPGLADCRLVPSYGPAGHYDGYSFHPSNFRPLAPAVERV